MVIIFSAIVLIALAYGLVIGWEKTKPKPNVQSGQNQPLIADEFGTERPGTGERGHSATVTREHGLQTE
jgi:hypothetical protein